MLIWLPEVSQPAVIHLVRSCHLVFHAHGEPAHMMQRPRADTPALRAAYRAFFSLMTLVGAAADHLGTTSPRDLGAVLISLSDQQRVLADAALRSVRLVPLGYLYQDGRDVYPDVLDAWSAPDGPVGGVVC